MCVCMYLLHLCHTLASAGHLWWCQGCQCRLESRVAVAASSIGLGAVTATQAQPAQGSHVGAVGLGNGKGAVTPAELSLGVVTPRGSQAAL